MRFPVKSLLVLLASLAVIPPCAIAAETAPRDVVIGQEHHIRSKVLGEERSIYVSKPGNYDAVDDRYSVLYVLDGRVPFYYTSAVARFLGANQRIPELLIVAVDNPAKTRSRDLTPAATAPESLRSEPTGGSAAAFRRFLAEELIPWVDSHFRSRPGRVLVGHSHGGLFAVDTLMEQPDMFDAYIAISPSLWWDDQRHTRELPQRLAAGGAQDKQLFITYSGIESTELRSGVLRFVSALEQRRPPGMLWKAVDLPTETHTSGPLRGIEEGLKFVFHDFWLEDPMALYDLGGFEAVDEFHARKLRHYGGALGVERLTFQSLSRKLLDAGRLDELVSLSLRTAGYRPPAAFHLQVAHGYRQVKRLDDAVKHYQLALQVDPSLEEAQRALSELRTN